MFTSGLHVVNNKEEYADVSLREKQFVQHLVEVSIAKVCNLNLPSEFYQLGGNFYDENSPLTESIVKALLILMFDFSYKESLCYDISGKFREEVRKPENFCHRCFLKFIANYSLKATSEYLQGKTSSPFEFYIFIVEYLKITREYHGADRFFAALNHDGVEEIKRVGDDIALLVNSLNLKFRAQNVTEERMFILDIMIFIFRSNRVQCPAYLLTLRMTLELTAGNSVAYRNNIFTNEIEYYIEVSQRLNYWESDEKEFIQKYCNILSTRSFNECAFIVFCIVMTKRAISSVTDNNILPPLKAFFIIVCFFENAVNENLMSFSSLVESGKALARAHQLEYGQVPVQYIAK